MDMLPPQVLGFNNPSDFRTYFFKHFVWAIVMANRCGIETRVMFTIDTWEHVFFPHGQVFKLDRAERMPWILEALQRPEEICEGHEGMRDVYLLTAQKWGEDFCVVVRKPNRKGVSHFVTAYPLYLKSLLKIRACNPRIWP